MTPTTFADQLFYVTAHLRATGEGRNWTGTGFVYQVSVDGGRQVPLLVMNRHMITGALSLKVRFVQRDPQGGPWLGRATEIEVLGSEGEGSVESACTTHPDPLVDVAALPLAPVFEEMTRLGAPPYYKGVSEDLVPTEAEIASLDSIESVIFAGYRLGYSTRSLSRRSFARV